MKETENVNEGGLWPLGEGISSHRKWGNGTILANVLNIHQCNDMTFVPN